MGLYNKSFMNMINIMWTPNPYDWTQEFGSKNLYGGTLMPLTKTAIDLNFHLRRYIAQESWAKYAYQATASGTVCSGMKVHIERLQNINNYSGFRLGSVASWGGRYNERGRQVKKIMEWEKDPEWNAPKNYFKKEYQATSLENWDVFFDDIIYVLQMLKHDPNPQLMFYNVAKHYIHSTDKEEASLLGSGIGYDYFLQEDLLETADLQIAMMYNTKDKLWGMWRTNPLIQNEALRVREFEMTKKDDQGKLIRKPQFHQNIDGSIKVTATGEKIRDREANGIKYWSHIWILIYYYKTILMVKQINRYLKSLKLPYKVLTPITDGDFYLKMARREDGLYIFGDNYMLIKKGKGIVTGDVSISDVYQGFLRRDGRNNLPFFIRLDLDHDCGGTGGSMTTLWNIEGLLIMWKAFTEGYLNVPDNKDYLYVKELAEESDTFLGYHWDDDLKMYYLLGVRLTRDAADARIPWRFNRKEGFFIHDWPRQEQVSALEFAQSSIGFALTSFDFIKYQEWIHERKRENSVSEFFGATYKLKRQLDAYAVEEVMKEVDLSGGRPKIKREKVNEILDKILASFMDNFDIEELERLAKPLILGDKNYSDYRNRVVDDLSQIGVLVLA